MWGRRCAVKPVRDCNDRKAKSHNVVNGGTALVENRLVEEGGRIGPISVENHLLPLKSRRFLLLLRLLRRLP